MNTPENANDRVGRASLPVPDGTNRARAALFPIDTRHVVFHGYERTLPHWRGERMTYFVTWRLPPKQMHLRSA